MHRTLWAVAALYLTCAASSAHALTGAICVSAKLNGSLKLRASGTCKAGKEIQLGSFDGTTLQFSGINVQVVSGAGTTDAAVNGKGNLIVGYNKGSSGQTRTGSHNLVVGDEHEYTKYGGLVAGYANTISGHFASCSGGDHNVASGAEASVSGGSSNTASQLESAVSGGYGNTASGGASVVSSGYFNTASGVESCASAGAQNTASGDGSSVSGGELNQANGTDSSISGGKELSQPASDGWAAGSLLTGNVVVGDFESP